MPIQDGWAPTRTARNPQIPNLPLETAAAAGPVALAGGDAWDHWSDVTEQQVFSTGSQQADPAAAADQPAADAWDHWADSADAELDPASAPVDTPAVAPVQPPADPWDFSADDPDDEELDLQGPVAASDLTLADTWDHWSEFVEDIAPEDRRVAHATKPRRHGRPRGPRRAKG